MTGLPHSLWILLFGLPYKTWVHFPFYFLSIFSTTESQMMFSSNPLRSDLTWNISPPSGHPIKKHINKLKCVQRRRQPRWSRVWKAKACQIQSLCGAEEPSSELDVFKDEERGQDCHFSDFQRTAIREGDQTRFLLLQRADPKPMYSDYKNGDIPSKH